MIARLAVIGVILATHAGAETLVTTRTVRSHAVLTHADLTMAPNTVPGALRNVEDAVGLEAQVILYAGRPIRASDLAPPALIERNQIVTLVFKRGGLSIAAEARSMERAAIGDRIRVMNLGSRTIVSGMVLPNGSVRVGGPEIPRVN